VPRRFRILLIGAACVVLLGGAAGEAAVSALGVVEAAVLGVVEGITEYLPVSSTGHLILAQRLLGIPASAEANGFAICIQAGAIAAVLLLYRQRVAAMTRGLLGQDAEGRRLAFAVGTAFLPAAVVGLTFHAAIEEHLFGLWPITVAWFVGGVAILLAGRFRSGERSPGATLASITPRMALLVGLAQCLALWPGTSRSLVTIVGGLLVGLSLPAAVEFSFLLGLVTLGAATGYEAVNRGAAMLATFGAAPLVVGFLTAAVSAALAVRWLVAWITKHGLGVFGWYRIALALVVATLLLTGLL
jgi:undecaprenyl-diphosphatase